MPSPRSSPRPSSPRSPNRPTSRDRPSGAALDPYGIYGARTATRLRDSQRRRRSQNLLAFFILAAICAGLIVAWKTRRINTQTAQSQRALRLPVSAAPIWIAPSAGAPGVLLIAGEDGRLIKTGAFSQNASAENPVEKTVLLETDFPLRAPLIFGETAFVPCEDGVLYAVSWRERKLIWRQRFDASLSSQPTLITVNKKPVIVAGSDAGLVLALDAASGRVLWRARLPAPIGNGLTSVESQTNASGQKSPARVLVPLLGGAAMRGGLWCLDGTRGKVLWRFPKDGRIEATQVSAAAANAGKVYGANDAGAVYSLDLQTGNYNSKTQTGWKTFVRPLKDGDQNQATLLRAAPLFIAASATSQNARLILGGNDGGVRGINANDGKLLWQANVGAPVSSLTLLAFADGRAAILVCNRSGELVLVNSENGAILKNYSSRGDFFVGAAVAVGEIYGLTNKGTVLRFDLSH